MDLGGIINGMKKIFALLLCVLPVVADAYIERNIAVLRIMDKDAGKVQQINIPVGNELQFEKIFINVRNCKQSDPFQAEDYFAFLEISDQDKGKFYSNWMTRNEPGQNPLQHPDYDVWLVRCE